MTSLTFDNFPAPTRHTRRTPRTALPVLQARPLAAVAPAARQGRVRFSTLALVGAIACLHAGAIATFAGATPPVSAPPHPVAVVIALAPPPPEPLPAPPPPKAIVPPPRLKAVAPPRAAVAQQQRAQAAVDSVPLAPAATDNAAALVAQPASVPAAAPAAAPPADEKVSEPRGYAGYLRNPAPDYPPAAQRRGLEGQVVLKVHVLASGQPDSVTVAKSSGHAVLDEAAIKAVVSWAFAPARRGQAPIDGWVQVPLTFKI